MKSYQQELIAATARSLAEKPHSEAEIHTVLYQLVLDVRSPQASGEPPIDAVKLRDDFRWANNAASRCALWCADFPGAEPNTCRYCGKHWRRWSGSKLDGHAACIVTTEFKQELAALLRDPRVTFKAIADAIGVTPAVVRSWTFPVTPTSKT